MHGLARRAIDSSDYSSVFERHLIITSGFARLVWGLITLRAILSFPPFLFLSLIYSALDTGS